MCRFKIPYLVGKFAYTVRGILAGAIVISIIHPWLLLPAWSAGEEALPAEAEQCADILDIGQEVHQLIALKRSGASGPQLNNLRSLVLRRILQGVLQVQVAEDRLEMEMAFVHDNTERQKRRVEMVDHLFTLANFLQFGITYTIEPYLRIHKRTMQSAVLTTVSGGVGLILPTLNILYDRTAKTPHLKTPTYFADILDGKPVDGKNLPPYIARYLDAPSPSSQVSRRDALNQRWQRLYQADMSKPETLFAIDDGKSKSLKFLNSRLVLLWSLYTEIQGFDKLLLSLLDTICDFHSTQTEHPEPTEAANLGEQADEAARLLHVEALVSELHSLPTTDSDRKINLQLSLMERILAGYLDMNIAVDKCQEQLNYQIDVALAQMTTRKARILQQTFIANFIQSNTLAVIAGCQFLRKANKIGSELFLVLDGAATGISTISLLAMHGGWRKNDSPPNSLADFWNLNEKGVHGFSPLVWLYLNDVGVRTQGMTRRQYLLEQWTKNAVVNMDITQQRNIERLAGMPSCKWETIHLILSRITLLRGLQEQLRHFDEDLLALLQKTWPVSGQSDASTGTAKTSAAQAAQLLGVEPLVDKCRNPSDQGARLLLTRHVLGAFLEANTNANLLSLEIERETQVMNRMIRARDKAVNLTNICNFYQLGILGLINNSCGLSHRSSVVLAGNRVNIVSGYLTAILAIVALAEQHGGIRPTKVEPNMLKAAFGMPSQHLTLTPVMVRYLDAKPLNDSSMTRRQELVQYWEDSKVLTVDVSKPKTVDKLSADIDGQKWWFETINLIDNRIMMLYDLRAILRTSQIGFDNLLTSINQG